MRHAFAFLAVLTVLIVFALPPATLSAGTSVYRQHTHIRQHHRHHQPASNAGSVSHRSRVVRTSSSN